MFVAFRSLIATLLSLCFVGCTTMKAVERPTPSTSNQVVGGDDVRVTTKVGKAYALEITAVAADAFTGREENSGKLWRVPFDQIEMLEVEKVSAAKTAGLGIGVYVLIVLAAMLVTAHALEKWGEDFGQDLFGSDQDDVALSRLHLRRPCRPRKRHCVMPNLLGNPFMSIRSLMSALVLALPALALSACDSGEGKISDDQSVPLQDDADAKRELGNIFTFFGIYVEPEQVNKTLPISHDLAKEESTSSSEPCDEGSYETETGRRVHSFEYFDYTGPVAYRRESNQWCSYYEDPESEYNGVYETGLSEADAEGRRYRYRQFGADGESYLIAQYDSDRSHGKETERAGSSETRYDGEKESDLYHLRVKIRDDYSADGTADNRDRYVTKDLEFGSDTLPFSAEYEPEQRSLNGSYRYSTNTCAGGDLTLTTLMPFRYGSINDSDITRFVGGSLKISSGTESVIVVFNADSSATLRFDDGSPFTDDRLSTISAEDMTSLYQYDAYAESVGGRICFEGIRSD